MTTGSLSDEQDGQASTLPTLESEDGPDEGDRKEKDRILRRMRIQIWAGTLTGFFLALVIGAAFIAVVRLEMLWSDDRNLTGSSTPSS